VVGEVGGAEGGGPYAVEVVLRFAQVQGEGLVEQPKAGESPFQAVDGAGGGFEVAVEVVGGGVVRGAFGQQPPLLALASPVEQVGSGEQNLSQLWQSRFQGQAPPSTTGWKVQKPPSAGVLRRDRSIARDWACSRVSGVVGSVRSSPGVAVPGPVTQTCCRMSSRSDWVRWM
jgi:hypothetical protein